MQIIYIDSLVCVNMFIDYIILYAIRKTLHINSKGFRLLLGSLLGGLITLGIFLPFYTTLFSVFYRIVTALAIVLTAFGFSSFRKLLIRSLAYFGISLVFCGTVVLFEFIFHPKGVVIYNDTVYFDVSPITLLITTLIAYMGLSIYDKLSYNYKIKSQVIKVKVQIDDSESLHFDSAVDTGCKLREPFSGLPVILVEKSLLGDIQIPSEKQRIIPFSTAASSDIIYGFKPKRVEISDKEVKGGCYLGICENKLKGEIKSIMGTELLDNL